MMALVNPKCQWQARVSAKRLTRAIYIFTRNPSRNGHDLSLFRVCVCVCVCLCHCHCPDPSCDTRSFI